MVACIHGTQLAYIGWSVSVCVRAALVSLFCGFADMIFLWIWGAIRCRDLPGAFSKLADSGQMERAYSCPLPALRMRTISSGRSMECARCSGVMSATKPPKHKPTHVGCQHRMLATFLMPLFAKKPMENRLVFVGLQSTTPQKIHKTKT